MKESDFRKYISSLLNVYIISLDDSIFDNKYNLNETDLLYLIYQLVIMHPDNSYDISPLLSLDDIAFRNIFELFK